MLSVQGMVLLYSEQYSLIREWYIILYSLPADWVAILLMDTVNICYLGCLQKSQTTRKDWQVFKLGLAFIK